ncbi:hypothetical protein ES703_121299 [subsurface metagenome]
MIRRLSVYLLLGLAAGLLLFFFTQRIATNLKASLSTLQEQSQQQLQEQMDWEYENVNKRLIEEEEAYQHQLNLIEGHADIVTEREADYLERMGRHSPEIREQFPHVTQVELWDSVYERELEHLDTFGRVSQRVVDQLIESREKAEAIERLFGNLEEQMR